MKFVNFLKSRLIFKSLLNRVLGVLACSRALGVYVLACSRAWRACVLTCLRAWRAFVLTCLTYVLAMMRAWHAQHWRTRVFV